MPNSATWARKGSWASTASTSTSPATRLRGYVRGRGILLGQRNRWITIHGTNYLVVRDCVGYQSIGHGFFLEDGTEVDNVFDRNLAVQAFTGKPLPGQMLPYDNNGGAGFWWANSRNTFTRNVAVECDRYGYKFEASPLNTPRLGLNVMPRDDEPESFDLRLPIRLPDGSRSTTDIRTLPFVRFEDNEAHSQLYGINLGEFVRGVGPDERHPFVLRNTRLWNNFWAFRPVSPSIMVDGMDVYQGQYGLYRPIYTNHAYSGLSIAQVVNPQAFGVGEKPKGFVVPVGPAQAGGQPRQTPELNAKGEPGKRALQAPVVPPGGFVMNPLTTTPGLAEVSASRGVPRPAGAGGRPAAGDRDHVHLQHAAGLVHGARHHVGQRPRQRRSRSTARRPAHCVRTSPNGRWSFLCPKAAWS